MNRLRIYINPEVSSLHSGPAVFFSRRADGPYYRWQYEEQLGDWHFSRMHMPDLTPSALRQAGWNTVPPSLKTRLGEHYLD